MPWRTPKERGGEANHRPKFFPRRPSPSGSLSPPLLSFPFHAPLSRTHLVTSRRRKFARRATPRNGAPSGHKWGKRTRGVAKRRARLARDGPGLYHRAVLPGCGRAWARPQVLEAVGPPPPRRSRPAPRPRPRRPEATATEAAPVSQPPHAQNAPAPLNPSKLAPLLEPVHAFLRAESARWRRRSSAFSPRRWPPARPGRRSWRRTARDGRAAPARTRAWPRAARAATKLKRARPARRTDSGAY
jgi:hypothetical protein